MATKNNNKSESVNNVKNAANNATKVIEQRAAVSAFGEVTTRTYNAAWVTESAFSAAGITLVYETNTKDKVTKEITGKRTTEINFRGGSFTPATLDTKKDAVAFRDAWRGVVSMIWDAALYTDELRTDNGAIRTKLRAGTPTYIRFVAADGTAAKFIIGASIWANIGITPNKANKEELKALSGAALKSRIIKAAGASFYAMNFHGLKFDK